MKTNFISQKLKFLFPHFLLLIFFTTFFGSCIISKNKRATSNVSETRYTNADNKPGSKAEYNLKPPFALLTVTYDYFLQFFNLNNFQKFKFVPYQRNPNDMVRLYCYALSTDYDASKIGEAFYISFDGTGEIPRMLDHPIIYDDLVLTKEEMKQIFNAEPVSVIYLTLVPVKATENGKAYNTYRVFKNGHDSKVQFNLAPKNFN